MISLFNHKGGVSKTTTTFNLAWTFADLGVKTLIVDADPQCNLTAYVLELQDKQSLDEFYRDVNNENIYSVLNPIITGKQIDIRAVKPCETLNDNLKLVAGNLLMSEFDIQITAGILGAGFFSYARQFVGSLNAVVRQTAKRTGCELILVDMSPSSGAMNRSILMSSDYFIIPTSPDFFSYQAIQALGAMFISWNDDFKKFRDPAQTNSLPEIPPKMLGVISQKYRPYTPSLKELKEHIPLLEKGMEEERKKGIASAYKSWIDKIQEASSDPLAKTLKPHNLLISELFFKKHVQGELPYNLISIGDFNSLIALSQENQKPIFALEEEELKQKGASLQEMKQNQNLFKELFKTLAIRIYKLIESDYSGNRLFKNLSTFT